MRFRSAAPRHAQPPAASPDAPQPDDEPPTAAPDLPAETAVLRVGDYEVGEGFCAGLYGHPEIRY